MIRPFISVTASVRGSGPEEGGQEGPPGQPVHPEDGRHEDAGNGWYAANGNGTILHANHASASEVLHPCSDPSPAPLARSARWYGSPPTPAHARHDPHGQTRGGSRGQTWLRPPHVRSPRRSRATPDGPRRRPAHDDGQARHGPGAR